MAEVNGTPLSIPREREDDGVKKETGSKMKNGHHEQDTTLSKTMVSKTTGKNSHEQQPVANSGNGEHKSKMQNNFADKVKNGSQLLDNSEDNEEQSSSALPPKHPTRIRMQALVERELRGRNPYRQDWQEKCKEMSLQLEEVIYRRAKSVSEYQDESTLSLRLIEIFMDKKKRDLARDREGGEGRYWSVLEKAKTRWLTGDEIMVLLLKCTKKMPHLVMMNDPAFLPSSGSVFHFASFIFGDGFDWLKTPGTNSLQENRFILSVDGKPRVCVAFHVDLANRMQRQTYWLADNIGIGVLAHYLSQSPQDVPHSRSCFCLHCLFTHETSGEQSSSNNIGSLSKRSRND